MNRALTTIAAAVLGCSLVSACANAPGGHAIAVDLELREGGADTEHAREVGFLTPGVNEAWVQRDHIAGKPYFAATFEGGFDTGSARALHFEVGEIDDELAVSYHTPPMFEPGPYDVIVVIYVGSEITQEMYDDVGLMPIPEGGDLSAFTLVAQVAEGDPDPPAGALRATVVDDDVSIAITNRLPSAGDQQAVLDALTDTVLLIP